MGTVLKMTPTVFRLNGRGWELLQELLMKDMRLTPSDFTLQSGLAEMVQNDLVIITFKDDVIAIKAKLFWTAYK